MNEDGSGQPYYRARAGAGDRGFFRLPFIYFTQGWHRELSLPGKAVLFIALAQRVTFTLVTER